MRSKKLILLFGLSILCISCLHNEEIIVTDEIIIGAWRGEEVEVKSLSTGEVREMHPPILYIGEDKSFFKNYSTGKWELRGNTLFFTYTILDSVITEWEYEITDYSGSFITMQRISTERDCCSFPEFESDENLLITEIYKRETQE